MNNPTLLAADIGGTKSDVALFNAGDVRSPQYTQRFVNGRYSGVEGILTGFIATAGDVPSVACFAVAGVVLPGTGLGEGYIVQFSRSTFVSGGEGGHTDFASVDGEQAALVGVAGYLTELLKEKEEKKEQKSNGQEP